MTAVLAPARRQAISPYARRLARERGLALEDLAGSGPGGRIVAADIVAFVPQPPKAAAPASAQWSTLATTIDLATVRLLLGNPAAPFVLDDLALRAAACALDDIAPTTTTLPGAPMALEARMDGRWTQYVFAEVRRDSLGALRARRLEALAAGRHEATAPASLSLRLLEAGDIRPVTMPLLPGRSMRLVLIAGPSSAECLLTFDDSVEDEVAIALLTRFKAYLESPILLLA